MSSIVLTTMTTGTIELVLALRRGRVCIRGHVTTAEGTVYPRSWVYLPPG